MKNKLKCHQGLSTPDQYWRRYIPEIPPVPGNSGEEVLETEVETLRAEAGATKALHDDEVAALRAHVVALREANGKLVSDMESLKEANKGLEDQVAELTNQVLDTEDQDVPPSERELLTVSQSYGVQDSFPGASPRGESILDGDTEDTDIADQNL